MSSRIKILIIGFLIYFVCPCVYSKVCDTEICEKFVQELKSSMNESVDPCDDFSSYICGNFGKTHPIPPGSTSSNSFSEIGDKVTNILKKLLETQPLTNVNIPQTKVALFYNSCMNKTQRDIISKQTMLEVIRKYDGVSNYPDALVSLIRNGITSRILYFDSSSDAKNPQYKQFTIGKPELILPEATLKSPEDDSSKKQIASQIKFMKRVSNILGIWKNDDAVINDIVQLNIQIAKFVPSVADQHDPDKYYNKLSVKALQELCPEVSWLEVINKVLSGTGKSLKESDELLLSSIPYFKGMCQVLKSYQSDPKLKKVLFNDLIWAELNSVLALSSTDLIEAADDLAKESLGVTGKEELWKTCVELTSSTFLRIMGNMYVKQNFDATKKKDIENMLTNIRNSLKTVIENVNWMDEGTKSKALVKLQTIKQKIGYPDSILNETLLANDHSELTITKDSLILNYYSMKKLLYKNSIKGIFEKIPDDKWYMGPHEVNAYYNPAANEIVFPAAILQYPFYDIGLPVTSNYGGVGAVIGHEILHGFDTSGSKFDEKGILRNWWTVETKQRYLEKTLCIQHQYGNYSVYGEKLPAEQTTGEDIADNAGIRMSYLAVQKAAEEKTHLKGLPFTPEQLFFVHEARIWCSNYLKEALLERMKRDVHTVWNFRIIGPLSNMPEFSKAFKCNHDKKMNRHKKCLVW